MTNSTKQKKDKFDDLTELKGMIESRTFQENIIKKITVEQRKAKKVSKYKSWEEVLKAQGKEEGLEFLINILAGIDLEIKNIKFDLSE